MTGVLCGAGFFYSFYGSNTPLLAAFRKKKLGMDTPLLAAGWFIQSQIQYPGSCNRMVSLKGIYIRKYSGADFGEMPEILTKIQVLCGLYFFVEFSKKIFIPCCRVNGLVQWR